MVKYGRDFKYRVKTFQESVFKQCRQDHVYLLRYYIFIAWQVHLHGKPLINVCCVISSNKGPSSGESGAMDLMVLTSRLHRTQ